MVGSPKIRELRGMETSGLCKGKRQWHLGRGFSASWQPRAFR